MIHQVQPKENLYRIGLRYGTSAEEIRILNGLKNYDINVGQIIKIPEKKEIIVAPTKETGLKFSDLCITDTPVPINVADDIILFHLLPMRQIMRDSGLTVWASLKSGYRPREYEISSGRGTGSEHTFENINKFGIGAVDWTTEKKYLDLLLHQLITASKYRRIAVYENFIHCDYKDVDGERRLYKSDDNSNWSFIKTI